MKFLKLISLALALVMALASCDIPVRIEPPDTASEIDAQTQDPISDTTDDTTAAPEASDTISDDDPVSDPVDTDAPTDAPDSSAEIPAETEPVTDSDTTASEPDTTPETPQEPDIQTAPETEPETSPETKPEPKPETEPETKPETKPEPEPDPEPEPEPTPTPEPSASHQHHFVSVERTVETDGEYRITSTKYQCECGEGYIVHLQTYADDPHDYYGEITKSPTCTEDGECRYTCSHCDKIYTHTVEKLGHRFVSSVTKQATASEPGIKTFTCVVCGYTKEEQYELQAIPDADVPTEAEVYSRMMAMQSQYPEGMRWTNDNEYDWHAVPGVIYQGYGCVGFAFILSDAAFGDLPAREVRDFKFEDIRPGDILRVDNDTHTVIVLEVHDDYVVIAEGNFNSSIHWGRTLTREEVEAADYIFTRYPD